MYEAKKIANYIVSRRETQRYPLTNLRINKLLYFIQGWSLNKYKDGVIRNHFEAWTYGPVIKTVYDELKIFESKEVNKYIKYLNYQRNLWEEIPFDDISHDHTFLIDGVLQEYAHVKTDRLVDMSHVDGGAWDRVRKSLLGPNLISRIPNELIREEFFGGLAVEKWMH